MEKLDTIYSTLQFMNENAILEFLIKMNDIDLNKIKDRTIMLKYINMIANYIKICDNLNLNDGLKVELKQLKLKIIDNLNDRSLNYDKNKTLI